MKTYKLFVLGLFLMILSACNNGDTTPPVITLDPSFSTTQVLGGMIQNPGGTCVDNVDATCEVYTQAPATWDGETPGTYTWTLIAEDRAGNVATLDVIVTYTAN